MIAANLVVNFSRSITVIAERAMAQIPFSNQANSWSA
jgi:hypothetical protein